MTNTPPVCDYEGSDYQDRFWEEGGRAYEDGAEVLALKRLLPKGGRHLLELGAGAGRNTRFLGTLWLQGESDIGSAEYAAALDTLIAGFRAGITGAADSKFVALGLAPEFAASNNPVVVALRELPGRVTNTAYVSGPAGYYAGGAHYTAAGLRIFGLKTFYEGWLGEVPATTTTTTTAAATSTASTSQQRLPVEFGILNNTLIF